VVLAAAARNTAMQVRSLMSSPYSVYCTALTAGMDAAAA
jgi:hypothetical protein